MSASPAPASLFPWPHADRQALAEEAECHETPVWAAEAILAVELLTPTIVDPCCGTGVLAEAAKRAGYRVDAADKHDWGYPCRRADFLADDAYPAGGLHGLAVLMNPPFSLAVPFVDRARALGARKILCFQRFAWRESLERLLWWRTRPAPRIWLCAERATCWRFDIPPEKRAEMGSTPTAHAWFVWERGHDHGSQLLDITKQTARGAA